MMKAKSFTPQKDTTTDPHKQVKGRGGVTSMAMKTEGSNMARAHNQLKGKRVPRTGI